MNDTYNEPIKFHPTKKQRINRVNFPSARTLKRGHHLRYLLDLRPIIKEYYPKLLITGNKMQQVERDLLDEYDFSITQWTQIVEQSIHVSWYEVQKIAMMLNCNITINHIQNDEEE